MKQIHLLLAWAKERAGQAWYNLTGASLPLIYGWLALIWVAADCLLAWSWVLMPSTAAARHYVLVLYPALMWACWMVAIWWAPPVIGRWIVLVRSKRIDVGLWASRAASILLLALTVISVTAFPDVADDPPRTLWRIIQIATALSFAFAWWHTPRAWHIARLMLGYGFFIGLFGPLQDKLCGPQLLFLQGSVCGGEDLEQYIRLASTALATSVLIIAAIELYRRART